MNHPVIPSVNCPERDFDCVASRVREVEELVRGSTSRWKRLFGAVAEPWVHLDVADGIFTFHKSWRDAPRWEELGTQLQLEVHLMVDDPISESNAWLHAGAKRLIVHAETIDRHMLPVLVELAERKGAEVMLASNPETDVEDMKHLLPLVRSYQVLAVHPGLAGQKFLPRTLDKIRALRAMYPNATIEVDGGVGPETGKQALDAGANALVSASYIFGADNPRGAYQELRSL